MNICVTNLAIIYRINRSRQDKEAKSQIFILKPTGDVRANQEISKFDRDRAAILQ